MANIFEKNKIMKTYTEEEVKELLKQQRQLCDTYAEDYQAEHDLYPSLLDAPEPKINKSIDGK